MEQLVRVHSERERVGEREGAERERERYSVTIMK